MDPKTKKKEAHSPSHEEPLDYQGPHPDKCVDPKIAERFNAEKEAAVYQIRQWLEDIYPPQKVDRAIRLSGKASNDYDDAIHFKIFTAANEYTIYVQLRGTGLEDAYMGASAKGRKQRPGENHRRGNDLADGKFSRELWQGICLEILRYEVQEIQSEDWKHPRFTKKRDRQCL